MIAKINTTRTSGPFAKFSRKDCKWAAMALTVSYNPYTR